MIGCSRWRSPSHELVKRPPQRVATRPFAPTTSIRLFSLGRTALLKNRRGEIIAWHKMQITNRPTGAANNLIKCVNRVAFGFRRFRNYRVRVLQYAGKPNWDLLATLTHR